jgi:hypothetical protein
MSHTNCFPYENFREVWQYQTLEENQNHHLKTKLTLGSASFMELAADA